MHSPIALGDRGVLDDGPPDLIQLESSDDLLPESPYKDSIDASFWEYCRNDESNHKPLADDVLAALPNLNFGTIVDTHERFSPVFCSYLMVSASRPRFSNKEKLTNNFTSRLEQNAT